METHYCHLAHVTQDLTTTPHDSTAARTELALWWLITLYESSPQWVPGRTPTAHWGRYDRRVWVARLTRNQHATEVASTTRCINNVDIDTSTRTRHKKT